jgi:PAS domain S-box-containing protein
MRHVCGKGERMGKGAEGRIPISPSISGSRQESPRDARLARLGRVMAALIEARTPMEIAAVIAGRAAHAIGAQAGVLALLEASGEELRRVPPRGPHPPSSERIPLEDPSPLARAARAHAPVLAHAPGGERWAAIPLVRRGHLLGSMAFRFPSGGAEGSEIRRVQRLGRPCAAALSRALFDEAERQAMREKQQLLRAVTEGTTDCVFVKDKNARYVMINAAGAAFFGTTPEAMIGKDDSELFRPGDDREIAERDMLIMASGRTVSYESTSTSRTGETRIWHSTKRAWVDQDGNVLGVVGVSRDITDRKRAEEAQRLLAEVSFILASSMSYEATLSGVARLLVPAFADACLVHVLEPSRELVCLSAEIGPAASALGMGVRDLGAMLAEGVARSVLRKGLSLPLPQLDAEDRDVLVAGGVRSAIAAPIRVRGQTIGAVTFLSTDPSRLHTSVALSLAQEIGLRAGLAIDSARLYREVQQVSRLKDEFLGVVSHELRTPLTAILGWSSVLRKGTAPEETRRRAVDTIERNALSQARLIDDLMDSTAILANEFVLERAEVDLVPLVEAAVANARVAAAQKGVHVLCTLERSCATLHADARRLRQVIDHLLSNALKFTQRGGCIEVHCRSESGSIVLRVVDDGEGIAADVLPHLFERFRQADSSTTRRHGGLGLGLSIVRHIVEAHGGEVRAESAGRGAGATFTVRLPLALDLRQVTLESAEERPPRLDGLSVLVVEDEADTRTLVEVVLARAGAAVQAAGSVEEALAMVRRGRPDLIVSDLGMPGEDGYALLRRLRAHEAGCDMETPAIALTAYTSADHRARALSAGYRTYLRKPVQPAELVRAAAHVSGRAGARMLRGLDLRVDDG